MKDIKGILTCKCSSTEHTLIFESIDGDVYVNMFLSELPLFKRIKLAIKYIFGYKCKYGHYEEIILDKSNIKELKEIIEYLEKSK